MTHHLKRLNNFLTSLITKKNQFALICFVILILLTLLLIAILSLTKDPVPEQKSTTDVKAEAVPLPNLVDNPSFEQMDNNFAGKWQQRAYLSHDMSVARTGTSSLKVIGNGGIFGYTFSRGIPVLKPNTTYTIQVWAKAENTTGKTGVGMRYAVTLPKTIIHTGTPSLVGASDWTLISKTFTTPIDYKEGRLDLTYTLNTGATAWFDDVYLCEGTNCQNTDEISPTQVPETPITISPTTSISVTPTQTPQVLNNPTLIESYELKLGVPVGGVSGAGYYNQMKYNPRYFKQGAEARSHAGVQIVTDPAGFTGWDLLTPPYESVARNAFASDYITLNLNRPAQVAIIWRNPKIPLPTWLSTWTKSDNVKIGSSSFPTYTKLLTSGKNQLGGLYNATGGNPSTTTSYLVLLAEQNSTPSTEPNHAASQVKPIPNQTCPAWVHDQHKTKGPDGLSYPTWHPQIDPVYWCYFRHEHGSNPDEFIKGYKVAYNYTATKQSHQHAGEGHPGFKTFVFDDNIGRTWLMTWHIGTGSLARVCNRFHSVDLAVKDTNSGELLADIHIMGDFGQAVNNRTQQLIKPPACPTQGDGVGSRGQGLGQRQIPVHTIGPDGYEPWVLGTPSNILGLSGGYHINTHNPMVICDTIQCAKPFNTKSSGAVRFFADTKNLKLKSGVNTGTFYTDASAKSLLPSTDPLAVKQFIKPGLNIAYPTHGAKCGDTYGWGRKLICSSNIPMTDLNRENSLLVPN